MTANKSSSFLKSIDDMEARYQRAQNIDPKTLVQNDVLLAYWVEKSNCFWYERSYKTCCKSPAHGAESQVSIYKEYRLVNADTLDNTLAFDHAALADALALASGQDVSANDLPLADMAIKTAPLMLRFKAFDRGWQFNCDSQEIIEIPIDPLDALRNMEPLTAVMTKEILSPDERYIAFARDDNLYVRDVYSAEERRLTQDGEPFFSYAAPGSAWGTSWAGLGAMWSPDSKRLLVTQRDTRMVKSVPIVDYVPKNGSLRPRVEYSQVAYPGDDNIEEFRLLTIDVSSGQHCPVDYQPIPVSSAGTAGFFSPSRLSWWNLDSRRAYFIEQTRGDQMLRLIEIDTDTGNTHVLFEEVSDTHIDLIPDATSGPLHHFLPQTNELIWWSERSGWGHLYLYDLNTGKLKNSITKGEWRVRDVLHIDTELRQLWIQTAGRVKGINPYYRDVSRVDIDTGELTTLLSSDHEYGVNCPFTADYQALYGRTNMRVNGISPNKQYFVVTRSRVDQAPVHLLCDHMGDVLMDIETADTSSLPNGWRWPESLKLCSADGKTDIYGVLFRPSNFDEAECYPVINLIGSAPWLGAVPKGSFNNSRGYADYFYYAGAALAELGFMVVILDSRGTPLRSKGFQDESYGWIASSGNTADHRAGLMQLSERYPCMDMKRVGVVGLNGYQSSIQNLMECPDLYKVGVINQLQDSRFISCAIEGDKYQGVSGPAVDKCFPEQLAHNWKGKLLLIQPIYGSQSAVYPPSPTFRLVEALRRANKDFDLLIAPHAEAPLNLYEARRAWDYLVRYLLGVEPPKQFKLEQFFM